MNTLYGPKAIYSTKEGNAGMTAFAIIDTSHICFHSWDEEYPGIIQLDVYSCAKFDKKDVFELLREFEPLTMDWKFLDRTTDFIKVL